MQAVRAHQERGRVHQAKLPAVNLRDRLVKALGEANRDADHKRQIFAAPYSSHDAAVAFFEARGVQMGLAKAIEILDAGGAT